MNKFHLISDLKPTGDQPQAIEKIFLQQNLSRKKRAKNIDEHAACWILQSALDSFRKK